MRSDSKGGHHPWQQHGAWHRHGRPFGSPYPLRARMFRRLAVAALILFLLALSGVSSLTWLATTRFGVRDWRGHGIVLFVALLAVIGATRAFRVMRHFASPLGEVMDAADGVAAGDYGARVSERGPPPVRALIRSFNTMTEKLQHADRQRRDLMADLAHELRTPLTVLQGRIEGLLDRVYPLEEKQVEQLLDQTKILSRLIEDLRTLALSDAGVLALQKEPTDIAALLRGVVESFAAEAARRSIVLQLEEPLPALSMEVDAVRIKEVLANLLSNALAHTSGGGSIRLALVSSAEEVSIAVADTGSAMASADVARMFDRFYKGRESRGSGLGLAIARSLMRAHGGDLRATSEPGKGTTLTCTLPRPPAVDPPP